MLTDMLNALAFLTILPVRFNAAAPAGRLLGWASLVGLLIGGLVSAAARLPLPRELHAFVVLLVWIGLTGGLHLDGFADSCDGLLATVDPPRRLEIMRDPRTGSWAVIGLIVLLLGKWVMLLHAASAGLILIPVIGRWAMVLAMFFYPPVRSSGAAVHFRAGFGIAQVSIATITALLAALMCSAMIGWTAAALIVTAPLCVWLMGAWASRRLGGGLTGDVYGAICELTEVLCLFLLILLH